MSGSEEAGRERDGFDLHRRRGDPFHSGCAFCGTQIPSNAPRCGDRFKNIYCCWDHAIKGAFYVDSGPTPDILRRYLHTDSDRTLTNEQ